MRSIAILLLAACATTSRARLGEIHLRPYTDLAQPPAVFSVQQGRILSPQLDATIEPDGCVRGTVGLSSVQLCSKADKAAPENAGNVLERWAGPSGDVTLELQEQGKQMRMDGYVNVGQRSLPMQATVPLGQGPQWEELRRHPILLALAAAATGVRGEPTENTKAE
jgi:hypothetical protein